MKHYMVLESEDDTKSLSCCHAALLRWFPAAITAGASIWVFFLSPFPIYPWGRFSCIYLIPVILWGMVLLAASGQRLHFTPWAYWLGAGLVYIALGNALNSSVLASWESASIFLFVVMLGIPIVLVPYHAVVRARAFCGIAVSLSLVILLQNNVFDLKSGLVDILDSGQDRTVIVTKSWPWFAGNMKIHEFWVLSLAWLALAALRPSTRRDWFLAASVFCIAGLAVATGYSQSIKLTFVLSICVFPAVFWAPRFTRGVTMTGLFALFLGAPGLARIPWLWFTQNPDGLFSGASRLVRRSADWRFWAEMVEQRPWTGFGINAYKELPGGIPILEPFAARELSYPASLAHHNKGIFDLVESPHSFPLQVWSDLGVFGALLLTGFVASLVVNTFPARPGDVSASARSTLIVAVSVAVCLTGQVVWNPHHLVLLMLAAGLAAGTLTAHERSAPAVPLPGLSLRGERFLILFVLLIGLLVAVGSSVRSSLADRRHAPEHTMLDLKGGVLRHRGEEIALDGQAVGNIDRFGYIDRGAHREGAIEVSGWAYDPAAVGEALQVLVFGGSELLGVTRTGGVRPDVQRTSPLPNLDLLFTGYELRLLPSSNWHPQIRVNAVFLSPSGSASMAFVTDSARRQMHAVAASEFHVHLDETGNALIYVREVCSSKNIGPPFFLHVRPVDEEDIPDRFREHSFEHLGFIFSDYGFMQDGRCYAKRLLPDYDIAEIRTGQFIRHEDGTYESIWRKHFAFN